jgi:hypothetical protein
MLFAFLATMTALRSTPAALRAPLGHGGQRTRQLLAQVGPPASRWTTGTDPDGRVFYTNTQTGQSQWEPPTTAAAGKGANVVWRVSPFNGVYSEFTLRNGEEAVLGRYDMVQQKLTVSRAYPHRGSNPDLRVGVELVLQSSPHVAGSVS